MGKKAVFASILLFLIVADVASATFLWNFRKLVSSVAKEDITVSPNPSPAPLSGDEKSKDKLVAKTPPPEIAKKDKKGGEQKDEAKTNEPLESKETCNAGNQYCRDTSSMFACVQTVDNAKKVLFVLIQNEGDNNLKVNVRMSTSLEKLHEIEVPKHQSKKINISLSAIPSQILLNAGSGDCALQIGLHVTKENLFNWIPSHSNLMTPTYGAYFGLLLATLLALGVFVCCKFRKRRQEEIPYQELEMGGMPEVVTADVETAEGWDQGWDDDWDDDKAVKSSTVRHPASVSANGHTASVSANGHTARSSNRDGWEDWDV